MILEHLTPIGIWENSPTEVFKCIKLPNTGDKPFVGQVVSDTPFVFRTRGKNSVSSTSLMGGKFTYFGGVDASIVQFLGGEDTGLGGLHSPTDFPLPPNYVVTDGLYSPIAEAPKKEVIVNGKVESAIFSKLEFGIGSATNAPTTWVESDNEIKLTVGNGETVESDNGVLHQCKKFDLPLGEYHFYTREKNNVKNVVYIGKFIVN